MSQEFLKTDCGKKNKGRDQMNRIAKFEKVSIGQFTAAWKDTFQERSERKDP